MARRAFTGLMLASGAAAASALSGCAVPSDASPRGRRGGAEAARPPAGSLAAGATASEAVRAQLAYALEHWADGESAEFGHLGDTDCVNFTSQTLLARGWQQDDEWWYSNDGGVVEYASAWISSTALQRYFLAHPELGTALDDDARARVKLGDIVQFDWDRSGDRDHTGVITAVGVGVDGRAELRYACHSGGEDYYSIDEEIEERHPGAAVFYWSVA